ncbi:MAG: hypothetical protein M3Q28_08175 [Pseudomonadota bacterium]|nr:hypothetical protein [Pseudomonadota bacterium]
MHFTLLVAGALLPGKLADALSASLETPKLIARLRRAQSAEETIGNARRDGNAHLDWLARELFSQPSPAATAPYAYAQLNGAGSPQNVWHAEPVHVEVARDQLIVQSLVVAPTAAESAQLLDLANAMASAAGCAFVRVGGRWFLTTDNEWVIDTSPLSAVVGTPVSMPTGQDAPTWNRLHNEIQIAWHADPVNRTRDENGMQTINALWLHGGGRWQPLAPIRYSHVNSDAPELLGAASAAGARGAPFDHSLSDRALLVYEEPLLAARTEDWTAWLQAMVTIDQRLARHASDAIDLVLTGNSVRTFRSRHFDRFQPWRRRTLTAALTE